MVTKLEYEDRYDKALRYIFGRTLICRNLEVATQLARTTGLDCVTLDGDQVSSKGSLTGGYFNKSRSRLEIQKTRSEKSDDIQAQASYFQNYTNSAFKGSLVTTHILGQLRVPRSFILTQSKGYKDLLFPP